MHPVTIREEISSVALAALRTRLAG